MFNMITDTVDAIIAQKLESKRYAIRNHFNPGMFCYRTHNRQYSITLDLDAPLPEKMITEIHTHVENL